MGWASGGNDIGSPLRHSKHTQNDSTTMGIQRSSPACGRGMMGEIMDRLSVSHCRLMPAMYVTFCHLPPTMVSPNATSSDLAVQTVLASRHQAADPIARTQGSESSYEKHYTTLMLRNLPNNYTRNLLIELLNMQGFVGKYDFLYFPVDFQTKCGLGFAFVNLTTHTDACLLKRTLEGFQKWGITSSKVCAVCWCAGDQQGLQANIERYRNSSVMHKSVTDTCKPVIFKDGLRAKFPCSTKKLWPPSDCHGSRVRSRTSRQA